MRDRRWGCWLAALLIALQVAPTWNIHATVDLDLGPTGCGAREVSQPAGPPRAKCRGTAFALAAPPRPPCLYASQTPCRALAIAFAVPRGVRAPPGRREFRWHRASEAQTRHKAAQQDNTPGSETEAARQGSPEGGQASASGMRFRRKSSFRAARGSKQANLKGKGQSAARSGSLYSIAIQHERRRNYSAARRMFELLLNSYETGCTSDEAPDGRVFLAWGKMEAKLKSEWAMRKAFAKGLQLIPDNTHIPHAWAIEELKMGNVQAARKLYRYALERDPSDGLVYQSFALLEQQQGNIDEARALLEEGTRRDSTNVFLWSACGVFESRQGRFEHAANMFQQATVLGPTHCQTWQAYGVLLEKMGKKDEAAEKFDRAIEIEPRSVPSLQAYGLMEARRGNYDKARALFQRGVDTDASHAPIFHAWARMEEELGNFDRARELFNFGVARAPDSVALLKAWALMELQLGHIDSSNQWYVSKKMGFRKMSKVSERLEMLRLLIEQRSENDLRLVMKWILQQRNQQLEKQVSKILSVGAALPADWEEGCHFAFGNRTDFKVGETVVVRTPGALSSNSSKDRAASGDKRVGTGGLNFGRVVDPSALHGLVSSAASSAREEQLRKEKLLIEGLASKGVEDTVLVHIDTMKMDGPRLAPSRGHRQQQQALGETPISMQDAADGGVSDLRDSMVTVQLVASEVGELLLSRADLIEMLRAQRGDGEDSERFNLHAQREGDRLRLQMLMDRYGEDYNLLNLPAWVREAQDEGEEEQEVGESPEGGAGQVSVEGESGSAVLEKWVQRRSDDDVTAFRKWFNDMYQRDPGVGMKMLDWKMPSIWDLPTNAPAPPVPTEWTRIKQPQERPSDSNSWDYQEDAGQGRLQGAESLLRRLLEKRTGVDGEIIRMAEFVLTMGLVSLGVIYGPPFVALWVQRGPERDTMGMSRPALPADVGGVDAYLIQSDFGLGVDSSEGTGPWPAGKNEAVGSLTPELRGRIKVLMREGKTDQEVLQVLREDTAPLQGVAVSPGDLAKMREVVVKEKKSTDVSSTW